MEGVLVWTACEVWDSHVAGPLIVTHMTATFPFPRVDVSRGERRRRPRCFLRSLSPANPFSPRCRARRSRLPAQVGQAAAGVLGHDLAAAVGTAASSAPDRGQEAVAAQRGGGRGNR
jgi:hypothetical protein